MKFLVRSILACLLLISCAPLLILNSQTLEKKTPSGSVSGTVTLKGKGVGGITVVLSAYNGRPEQATYQSKTDQDGQYRITNVPPGSYRVNPEAPAFVSSSIESDSTLIIAEGDSAENINFSLVKGGVVTGRITNTDGQPLIEQQVWLMPGETDTNSPGNVRRMPSLGNVQNVVGTDDRGVYRFFGLPQGKYIVSVGRGSGNWVGTGSRRRSVPQTFYPNATDRTKATVVEVTEGGEVSGIDIAVDLTETAADRFSVSGRIVDAASGEPVPNLRIGIEVTSPNQRQQFTSSALVSDTTGKFKQEGIAPGKYALIIQSDSDSDLRADPVPFEIIDGDVNGLVIKASKGASVSGQFVIEPEKSKALKLSQLVAHVGVVTAQRSGFGRTFRVAEDGSFHVGGLQDGTVNFYVDSENGSVKGIAISRLEREGVIQPHEVIEIKSGEQVTGLKVFLLLSNGTVRGVLKPSNGEFPPAARFSVWLTRSEQDVQRLSLPVAQVDSRGHFVVEGLPAGTYELNASVFIPDRQRGMPVAKQQVTVADGVVSEVTITIDLSPGP